MLCVFHLDVFILLYSRSTLFFMTLLIDVTFGVSPESLSEPFSVSTLVGESIITRQMYIKCPITVLHRFTLADLIELGMIDFDLY